MVNIKKYEESVTGLIWIIIIYAISLFLLINNNYSLKHNLYFSIFIILFLIIYLISPRILNRNVWLYFLVEGIIVYISAFFMSDTYPVTTALYPLLLGQAILIVNSKRWVLIVLYFMLFLISSLVTVPNKELLMFMIIFMPLNIIIISYAFNLYKLRISKLEIEESLYELEKAYDQLEYLTLKNERQRMARDLHDILAQGLTGIKMQLEVIDIYLKSNKTHQALNLVKKSKKDVSNTLITSRMVIDDLHHLNNNDEFELKERIENKIEKFNINTGLDCKLYYRSDINLDNEKTYHIEYIISEALFNIARHAKASNVVMTVQSHDSKKLILEIEDNGIGFGSVAKLNL